MNSIPVVALVSGLVGAVVSAWLSYIVRLKAKAREDADERRRLAHVNFLALTDPVASNHCVKQFIDRVVKLYDVKLEGFAISHAAAAFVSEGLTQAKAEDRAQIQMLAKRLIALFAEASSKLEIVQSDLGRMSDVTIYSYYRYQTASSRLKHTLLYLETYIEQGLWRAGELASAMHAVFSAYGTLAQAAGILRVTLQSMAGVSDDYAFKCLMRSYSATQKELVASLEQGPKLDLAKRAAQEAGDATLTGASER